MRRFVELIFSNCNYVSEPGLEIAVLPLFATRVKHDGKP